MNQYEAISKCTKDVGRDVSVCKKIAKKHECEMVKVVDSLAQAHNRQFKILQLPQSEQIDFQERVVIYPVYKGRRYNYVWEEPYGGKSMGLELSREIPLVLSDLVHVDVRSVERQLPGIENLKFDYNKWRAGFDDKVKYYQARVEYEVFKEEDVKKAKRIFEEPFSSKFVFNNGDFYPRNFVKVSNRMVLLDWDTWSDGYRANIIDYAENIMAFCFIHMWGNLDWQLNYLGELQKLFYIHPGSFQKALLIKSFEQAGCPGWLEDKKKGGEQLKIFRNSLDREYVEYLLSYTKPSFVAGFVKKWRIL